MMKLAYIMIVIVGVVALVGTLMVAGKSDENYSSATKGNLTRILKMYVILGVIIILGAIAVIFYLF